MASATCILCGGAPPPPLTGEHLWPDWYNRQQSALRYELESIIEGQTSFRPTQAMNLKPRVLCHPCNTNWGSKLEDRIGPILTPMIQGEARQITPSEAQLISAWFFLKVMVSEYLLPAGVRPQRFFELEHGEHLKATFQPREGVAIWIGRYVGSRANAGWITDRSSARRVSDDPPAAILWHSVTYSIGQVLLHLFAGSRPVPLPPTGNLEDGSTIEGSPISVGDSEEPSRLAYHIPHTPGDWANCLIRIWEPPSGPISWPPQKSFDDGGFVYLADRWNVQEPPGAESKPEISDAPCERE
jgi:hypothetical protein